MTMMSPSTAPCFSQTERQRRWDLTQSFLSVQGLDALIIYGEHEDAGAAPFSIDNWLTNDRPGSTIVFPLHGEPIQLVPFLNFFADHMEGLANGDSIWIQARNMRAGRDADSLVKVLVELGLAESTIGVLGLGPAVPWHPEGLIPYMLWDRVKTQLPAARFRSVEREFIPLLLRLSDEEISVVKHAANIGEDMAKKIVQTVQSGVAENEIYAAGMAIALHKGTIVPWMMMNTGPDAVLWGPPRWAWRPQSPRILQSGDLVALEIFCNYGMRQTQHQLTIAVGPIPDEIKLAATVARASYEAGMEALQPYARFGDVANAMLKPVQEAGGWTKGPQLHSLNPLAALCGFSVPPFVAENGYPKVEGMPTILADIKLEPGMTFAFEPSCGFGKRAVTLGGTIILGPNGPIELNPFTARLHSVNDGKLVDLSEVQNTKA